VTLGTGRDKIESPADLEAALEVCEELLQLDGLVVVGGDDSNTNAAYLAEYFQEHGSRVVVLGVPKTIDGDLKSADVPISFGFDTATKVYSELVVRGPDLIGPN
jgi:pyrophosphate--fructose-6-phosphate 1-phosphotransferase